MATVGSLNIMVGTNIAGLKSGLAGASSAVKKFSSGIGSGLSAGAGLLAGLGISAGLQSAAEEMDALLKASDTLGISTENLAGLKYAAEQTDVPFEALTKSIFKMEDSLATAATTGKGPTADALTKLGLSAGNLVNMRPDEAFTVIGDALNGIENPLQRNALAMDIFGKGAATLGPLLKMGGDGINAATQEAEKLNLAFSQSDHEKVDAAGDAVGKLKNSFKGLFQLAVVELAGGVGGAAETAAFSIASIGKKVINAFKVIKNEVGFFIGTWPLQWERAKIVTLIVWDTIKAGAVASFDAVVAGLQVLGTNFMTAFENFPKIAIASWEAIKAGAVALWENLGGVFQDIGATVQAFAAGTVAALKAAFNLENPLTAFSNAFESTFADKSSGAFAAIGEASSKAWSESIAQSGGLKAFESVSGAMGEAFTQGFAGSIDNSLDARKREIDKQLADTRATFDEIQKGPAGGTGKSDDAKQMGKFATATTAISDKLAGATQAGSSEALSAIIGSMAAMSANTDNAVEDNTGETADNTQKTAENTERIADALEDLDMVEAF